ncbi:MAG: hypothetical protein FWC52_05410 [Candidatus Methanoplasma sp.]|nr:hypothetical protein [Candidatus Methanoplasma sp.]
MPNKDIASFLSRKVDLPYDSDLADTLLELRAAWGEAIPSLNEAVFDELAENYGGEDYYEGALTAFAQELTTKGYQLFLISEDVDTFIYAAEDEIQPLEKLLKGNKERYKKLKQQGCKFGMPAKRNDTAGRMMGKFPQSNEPIAFKSIAGDRVYGIGYEDGRAVNGFAIDLSQSEWKYHYYEKYHLNVVYDPKSQTFAGWDSVSNRVVIGKEPNDPHHWKAVSPPALNKVQRLFWCGGDLFFGYGENIFVVQNGQCVQLSSSKIEYSSLDFLQTGDGKIYASNNAWALFCITKDQSGRYVARPHTFKFMQNGFLLHGCANGNNVLYCQPLVEKGKIIPALIQVNMDSGRYSYAKLKHMTGSANIKDWDNEFWYVDGMLDPLKKSYDMAQFISKKTGEIYRIRSGALGKYRLSNAVRLSDGKIVFIISVSGSNKLFKPDDFWGYLKEMNPNPEKLEWNESEVLFPNQPKLE